MLQKPAKGLMIVVSGPAGSGKGTVLADLRRDKAFAYSVSATTRAPRPGEVDGEHYYFLTREEFKKKIARGEMLEYTEYCGNLYGTPKKEAERVIESGKHLLLEIEVQGAKNIKRAFPHAVTVMLLPPSFAVQEQRLRDRGTESEERILGRLERTKEELQDLSDYDYIVLNPDGGIADATAQIRAIVKAAESAAERFPDLAKHYFEN